MDGNEKEFYILLLITTRLSGKCFAAWNKAVPSTWDRSAGKLLN